MWLEKAERAGFIDVTVLRRQPMTIERLTRYPIYQEQSMKNLLAQVAPTQRDSLVEVALIVAHPGTTSMTIEAQQVCPLSPGPTT
ncbi:MAG: hypothetical protein NVSMB38_39930 [Ktedonobacteraceae bacterium]